MIGVIGIDRAGNVDKQKELGSSLALKVCEDVCVYFCG
ncbi:Hypothetical protein CpOVI2C_01780 [Corynebacterium pseudotuberculosis]|nr:hypothetical protein CPTC_01399 [Corynebacterium pseudotuberculosis]AKC73608.1 Hypothetical protein Cp226_0880 [Corynebacterium pseudotuberculosis]AKP08514.1 Hypothetical protein Cp262_0849 [Corynebacterium pseudotuberculosis]AUY07763.1 Hypothetical protein CpOVI2C_01780 [Corynebacterium pseudotuberculosis]AUZ43663.1 Hypothetical protein CpOVI03_01779 [Corynebacterium pseudotuberculosis]